MKKSPLIKVFVFVLILAVIIPFVFSCSRKKGTHLVSAVIFKEQGNRQVEVTNTKQLEIIENYVREGDEQHGIINVVKPSPYSILLKYSDGKEETIFVYLYDQDEASFYVKESDSHKQYRVKKAQTDELKQLFDKLF